MNKKMSIALMLFFFGLIALIPSVPNAISLLQKTVNVLEEDIDDLHAGQHVTMDVSMAYDALISVTTETTRNGKKVSSTESSRYYAVPAFVYEGDLVYLDHLILIEVNSSDFSLLEKGINLFDKWWEDESGEVSMPEDVLVSYEGTLKSLSKKERSYVESYFEDEDFEEYMPPYVFKPLKKNAVLGITLAGSVMVAGGVLLMVLGVRDSKAAKALEKQQRAEREASGYYNPPVDNVTFNNDRNNDTLQ